jgi:SAM-dependent methyltransferase
VYCLNAESEVPAADVVLNAFAGFNNSELSDAILPTLLTLSLMQDPKRNEWFATWFDSPYYHILYQNRDDREARDFIERLCAYLRIPAGARLLDLACGAGRHSRVLHSLGYDVTGVDLSANSICQANQHATAGLRFYVHDMREPLPETFDAILNLFTSFGYFDSVSDNARVLASVHNALHDDGVLVIDFFNAEKVIRELKTRQEIERDGILFHIKKEVSNGKILKTIAFEAGGQSHFYQEKVQALDLVDFQQLLGDAQFTILHTFGNYALEPFNVVHSDRLILICKKR